MPFFQLLVTAGAPWLVQESLQSLPPSFPWHPPCLCVFTWPSLRRTPVWIWGPPCSHVSASECNLLQRPYFQISSHPEVPGVRTAIYLLLGNAVQALAVTVQLRAQAGQVPVQNPPSYMLPAAAACHCHQRAPIQWSSPPSTPWRV